MAGGHQQPWQGAAQWTSNPTAAPAPPAGSKDDGAGPSPARKAQPEATHPSGQGAPASTARVSAPLPAKASGNEAEPGSTQPQPQPNKSGYRRSYKACDSCRARKIRCDLGDLDAPSDPPCKRCKRERQDCTFTVGVRGNRHGRSGIRASMAISRRHLGPSDDPSTDDSSDMTSQFYGAPSRAQQGNPDPLLERAANASKVMHVSSSTPTSASTHSAGHRAPHQSGSLSTSTSSTVTMSAPPGPAQAQFGTVPLSDPARTPYPAAATVVGAGSSSSSMPFPAAGASSLVYTYAPPSTRLPPMRPTSFEFAAPQAPSSHLSGASHHHHPTTLSQALAGKHAAFSPVHSASTSSVTHGPSPASSTVHPSTAAQLGGPLHPHSSSPSSSSASPAASADSRSHGGSHLPHTHRGRGLRRSANSSSSSHLPTMEAGPTTSATSVDRAALAQVSLQNSRDALKLLATLAGGAKHSEDERDRERDRSRERAAGARERSRDRLRERSRERYRDSSRERSRERASFIGSPSHNHTSASAAPGGPASSATGSSAGAPGRSSLTLGAVHRMQRPSVTSSTTAFQFNAPASSNNAIANGEIAESNATSRIRRTNPSSHLTQRLISASAPSTPRGESGAPRFGSMHTQRTVRLHWRDSSRDSGLGPALEEEGDELIDSDDDLLWPRRRYSRQTTPLAPSRLSTLADFEPVRLKLVKRSEVKMLVDYYFEHIHVFSPHCAERYASWTPEVISELVEQEPILLGAILSVASRYCHSGATNIWPDQECATQGHNGVSDKHPAGTNGKLQPVSWQTHLQISSWTHSKVGRALFDPSLHTIGTIEALLMLSEWSTIDIDAADMVEARHRQPNGAGDEHENASSEAVSSDDDDDDSVDVRNNGGDTDDQAAADLNEPQVSFKAQTDSVSARKRKRTTSGGTASKRRVRRRTNFLPKAHLFDAMAWQLISMAARMAEALDIHNEASYYGLDSHSPESRDNAERRLRVWMRVVHCDTQLSIRLGRRGMTDGALTPAWLETLRSHAFRVLETGPVKFRPPTNIGDTRISPRRSKILAEAQLRAHEHGLVSTEDIEAFDRQNRWVQIRAFAELMETVANARDLIHLKSSTTEAILLDDKFEVTLRCIRTSLEAWARWVSARVGNTMAAFRLRIEYHETRLYAYGPALDALVQRISRVRSQGAAQANDMLSANENLLIHPAYPFAVEAVGAAQTMIRMLTSEIESLRCAPARYFLLIVYASLFLLKASAASSVLLPLPRCLASVQAVINTLLVAGPDRSHLCRRYALLLRKYAKQFLVLEVEDNNVKVQTPMVGPADDSTGVHGTSEETHGMTAVRHGAVGGPSSSVMSTSNENAASLSHASATHAHSVTTQQESSAEAWSSVPSAGLAPGLSNMYVPFASGAASTTSVGGGGGDILTAYDWMWDDIVNPNFAAGNDVVDVDDFLQWLDTAGGAPGSNSSTLGGELGMNFGQDLPNSSAALARHAAPVATLGVNATQGQHQRVNHQASPRMAAPSMGTTSSLSTAALPQFAPLVSTSKLPNNNLSGAGHASPNTAMGTPMAGSAVEGFVPMAGLNASALDVDAASLLASGQAQSKTGLGQEGAQSGDLRKLNSGWFASVMGSINRMT